MAGTGTSSNSRSCSICGTHRLRDLGRPEHVFALVHEDLSDDFGSLRSLDTFPNNLPDQLTSFVGRAEELRALRAALSETRLLTLTGAGVDFCAGSQLCAPRDIEHVGVAGQLRAPAARVRGGRRD